MISGPTLSIIIPAYNESARIGAALEQARQGFALHADADSRRLLATCELLNGNWAAALAHSEQMLETEA